MGWLAFTFSGGGRIRVCCASELKNGCPMYSEDDLEAAVVAGALTTEAAAGFRDFMARRRSMPVADEESVRLLTGFNDIFVTIAALLVLVALGWLGTLASPVLGPPLVAAASWGFAEYFTRRRRMALPSIALLGGFVWGGYFTVGPVLDALGHSGGSGGVDDIRQGGLRMALSAGLAAVAAYGHWRRFRVPITVAAGTGAAAATVLALAVAMVPSLRAGILPLVFLAGIAVFALAMWWDGSDRARQTRRSDVAFWLHLTAAPLIVHPAFAMLGADGGSVGAATMAVAIYLGLALVALAVDRRALLVSALFYVLYAMSALFKAAGSLNNAFAFTALIIGSALLLLSAFWHHVRKPVLSLLPPGVRGRLPAAGG